MREEAVEEAEVEEEVEAEAPLARWLCSELLTRKGLNCCYIHRHRNPDPHHPQQ